MSDNKNNMTKLNLDQLEFVLGGQASDAMAKDVFNCMPSASSIPSADDALGNSNN